MGCSTSMEDKILLSKLDRLEIQVKKEKELKKLSEMEGRKITSFNEVEEGYDTRTELKKRMKTTPNENFDTYTSKDKSKKKKKRYESESKSKKKKKDKDEKSRKRNASENGKKKKKKK